jgi:hypothetical protein
MLLRPDRIGMRFITMGKARGRQFKQAPCHQPLQQPDPKAHRADMLSGNDAGRFTLLIHGAHSHLQRPSAYRSIPIVQGE